jgi:hypothetical protein
MKRPEYLLLAVIWLVTYHTTAFVEAEPLPNSSTSTMPGASAPTITPKIDVPQTPPLSEEAEVSAFAKAMTVLAETSGLHGVRIGHLAADYEKVSELKKCSDRPDSDIKEAFIGTHLSRKIFLVSVKGESTGLKAIFGFDCSNLITLYPRDAIILSLVAEAAIKHGKPDDVVRWLAPHGLASSTAETLLNYATEAGSIAITNTSPSGRTVLVKSAEGQTLYHAVYELTGEGR